MNKFTSEISSLIPVKIALTILLLLIGVSINAANIQSYLTGNWSATAWPSTQRNGNISSSTSSLIITGTGTSFRSDISIGNIIKTWDGITTIGTVASITDDTHLTLVSLALSTNNNIQYSSQGVGPADAVTIVNGARIYVDKSFTCLTLSMAGVSTITSLTINTGFTLTVTGAITMEKPTNNITNSLIVGDGFLISGPLSMKAATSGRNDVLSINSGTATINGNVSVSTSGCLITFTAAGTLKVSGSFSSKPTITQFNGNTWNYNGAAQTVLGISYNNLTLSGSDVKTFSGVTVNGILSMEGTATASNSVSYGTSATLEYNTTISRTAGPEWISPFVATGGIIIANTGTITLNSAEVVNAPLTINAGATLNTNSSSRYGLTFGGNFINYGTLSAYNSSISISGTGTQSISGFTTTGSVSMTKTAGTATLTGNLSCGSLNINGIGGTLNLGTGLNNIVGGAWALSNGTVAGNSSTLTVSGNATSSSGTFTQGTSTVIYNGTSAPQSTANVPYYNLILSGTGLKTLQSGSNAIGNDLTVNGTASFTAPIKMTIGGDFAIGAGTTFSGSTFIHNLGGNWTNNGTYNTGTGGINFNGTTSQFIGGSGTNLFNMLTISNASGVSLSDDVSVTGTLSFVSGKISTGAYSLSLGNFAVVTGASSGKYIYGNMQMGIPAATTVRTFDIGDATVYTPVTLSFSGTTNGTGSITMNTITGNSPNISSSNINEALSVSRYWNIANNGVTGFSSYDATFNFIASDIDAGADYTSFIAGEYSSSWVYPAVGTTNSTSVQVTGMTTFGQFQLGESTILSGAQYSGNGITPSVSGLIPCINIPSNPLIISSSFAVRQYFTMNVIKGITYEVYTCNSTEPSNPLMLTVYKEGAPTDPYIAFSSVNTGNRCSSFGNDVYVSFTPSFSGEVRVLVNRKGNSNSTSPAGLTIKANVTGGNNTLDDQTMAGTDKWVGHIYDGVAFNNYLGYYLPGAETFQESYGTTGTWPNNTNDDATCFNLLSGGTVRASVSDISFSARYRMTSTRRGLYIASMTSDDGSRLSVDNTSVYSNWSDHSPITSANVLFNLTGSSSLSFEYYENGGQNVAGFAGLVQVLSNTLSQNLNQNLYLNVTGLPISGDIFGTLPTGISLSGTGYQWAYSSLSSSGPWINITGATSATYTPASTVAPFNVSGTYYIIRKAGLSSINNIAPSPYIAVNESNYAVLTIKMPAGTWLGVTSNDWHTSSNWSGGVPTYTTDIVISSGTPFQPSINSNIAYCRNVTINTGSILTINANAQLLVAGTIVNNAGTSGLVLQSDASGSASLIHNSDNVQSTVNRYISGGTEAWHLLSSPVSNQTIAADWLPAGTYGNGTGYDMYVWDEPSGCWIYKLNTTSIKNWNTVHPSANFMVGRGYLYSVQSPNPVKQFKGILNNGNISIPVTAAATNLSLTGFNLAGNPYPSSIDWQAVTGWSRAGLVPSGSGYDMWIWNPAASNYGVINSAGGTGTNGVTRYISAMQGFFVRAKTSGNLGITNDTRVLQTVSWLKRSMAAENSNLGITINSEDGKGFDEVQLSFGSDDNESGAMKLFSPVETAPGLYLTVKDQNFSLRYLTDTVDNPSVPLMFKPGFDGYYTLQVNDESDQFAQIILEDTQLHTFQDIKMKNIYRFKSMKTDAQKRFIIHFTKIQKTVATDMPVVVYTTNNNLVVNLEQVNLETEIMVSDMMGRILLKEKLQGRSVNDLTVNSKSQVLIVSLRNRVQTICRKVMWINN